MDVPGSWRGVRNRFKDAPDAVTEYFEPIPELVEHYPWEVSIAYAFSLLEKSHTRALYAGAAKLHRANTTVARSFVDDKHITRKEFQRLFRNVFGTPIPKDALETLKEAEKVRDKILHGKETQEWEKRKALVALLAYAERLDELVWDMAGFRPFAVHMRGFVGRREPLDRSTTKWLMRGLGFGKAENGSTGS